MTLAAGLSSTTTPSSIPSNRCIVLHSILGDIQSCLLCFVQELEPLPTLVKLPALSELQLEQCRKVLLDLQAREAANEPLAIPSSGGRNKGVKR